MKIKTSELTGPALDWAVAKALWGEVEVAEFGPLFRKGYMAPCIKGRTLLFQPSTDPAQAYQIIERERIWTRTTDEGEDDPACLWRAEISYQEVEVGPTPLIAAMRCFVALKFGDTVEVPDELV